MIRIVVSDTSLMRNIRDVGRLYFMEMLFDEFNR